jgi:hypothetical protein
VKESQNREFAALKHTFGEERVSNKGINGTLKDTEGGVGEVQSN